MRTTLLLPLALAFAAALGNALVVIGQKKAAAHTEPLLFGALSLFLASLLLFGAAYARGTTGLVAQAVANWPWVLSAAFGLVLLNFFLYLLYRMSGANAYTLYALLAMSITSVLVSSKIFHERITLYHWASLILAACAVLLHLKGSLERG